MTMRHGILGLGAAGRIHAEAIIELGGLELVGFDPSAEARTAFLRAFPGTTVVDSLDAMIARSCGTVSIATPHDTHFVLAQQFLTQGTHVLIEKPACLDLQSLQSLIETAERHGARCATVMQHRLSDPILWIAEQLHGDALGAPYQVEAMLRCSRDDGYFASSQWRGSKEHEGGTALINQGLHLVDLCCFLFGEPEVHASATRVGRSCMDTEDAATAIFSFSDGTMGVLAASVSASIRWSGQIGIYGKRHYAVANVGFPDSIESSDLPVPEALRPRGEVSRRERHEPHIRAVQRFVSGTSPHSQSLIAFAAVLRVVTQLYGRAHVIDVGRRT